MLPTPALLGANALPGSTSTPSNACLQVKTTREDGISIPFGQLEYVYIIAQSQRLESTRFPRDRVGKGLLRVDDILIV
ncbi:hypothetical protein LIPSTDRAFT_106601 [Lipomyces starkeyi NRRL Y-11557]|uniref:Uncharacterized protein n=1 Tax=Lipomyces starkeyi NRRL Y-11557 TaxID=675824 RepID=A0A1E3PZ71_LIPST|nr:hypothetical protein LIPSTDRAFT_106601 [Lipomyces starkeyi NRRL Y-11557]